MHAPTIAIPGDRIAGLSRRQASLADEILAAGHWLVTIRRHGHKGVAAEDMDHVENLVVNGGLDKQLDAMWVNGQATPTWYLGLTDGTPTPAASDTMSSHPGWTEVVNFDEASRVVWTPGAISSQAVSNLASPARFTLNSNGLTIGGTFATDNATKGGSTGLLATVGAFQAGDKLLDSGDTLDVTAQFSLSSS
jgi:hypothetical protein